MPAAGAQTDDPPPLIALSRCPCSEDGEALNCEVPMNDKTPSAFLASDALTTFVGRQKDMAGLATLMATGSGRLITLMGTGGVGKTRLAVHFARTRHDTFPDGVVQVPLEEVTDPHLAAGAILEAAGAGQPTALPPLTAITEHFSNRKALLLLDNCEHLLPAIVPIATELLSTCPDLYLLVTSRTPLCVPSETVYVVPPLPTKATADRENDDADALSDAARLFIDRAGHSGVPLRSPHGVASVVNRIVQGLDGIPLAIELAAARARVMALDEIADALDDRLWLLGGGSRTAQARHRTMRASINWSESLLEPQERTLMRRLSVFSGGWTRAAAEAVCADEELHRTDILDLLAALVDKSLVAAEHLEGPPRFRMLTPIRQYAAERLTHEPVESAQVTERHGIYYTQLAEQSDRELWAMEKAGRAHLDLESANLRSAIDWACHEHRSEALRITTALNGYWRLRGRHTEGVAATELALASADPEPSPERALALATLCTLLFYKGDLARTIAAATQAIETAEDVDAPRAFVQGLTVLGTVTMFMDPRTGYPMLLKSAELAHGGEDRVAETDALTIMALCHLFQEDFTAMDQAVTQALDLAESINYANDIRWCLWATAHRALADGQLPEARALAQRATSLEGGGTFSQSCAVAMLSLCDTLAGNPETGRTRALAQLHAARKDAVRVGMGALLHALGTAELASGRVEEARTYCEGMCNAEGSGVGYLTWRAHEVLMHVCLATADPDQANTHADEINTIAEQLDNPRAAVIALCGHARAAAMAGDSGSAENLAYAALATAADRHWWPDTIACLEILTTIAVDRRRYERAALLIAGIEHARATTGFVRYPHEQRHWDSLTATTSQALPTTEPTSLRSQRAPMSIADMVEHVQRGRGRRARPSRGWQSITPVERQVAELAAQGLTNPQIAERLCIARSTAKAHIAHILTKLQIANRTELAAYMSSQQHLPAPVIDDSPGRRTNRLE
ncbi:LuxR C-terminal-related transcriptional regulator [Streptomyces sp. NPDC008343]|uniref:helix-turn-helix transcriptional regulator n=1 Tax=Streptomyces sp. NPDC008343 TaxID=3364828 RepID=UPI0036E340AB